MDINSTVELRDGRIGQIVSKFLYKARANYEVACEGVRVCVTLDDIAGVIANRPMPSIAPDCPAPVLGTPSLESRTEYAFSTALDERKFAQERARLESEIAAHKAAIAERLESIKTLERTEKRARQESRKMLNKGLCVEAVIAQLRSLFSTYATR